MTEATVGYPDGSTDTILVDDVAILDSGVLKFTRAADGATVLLAPAAWTAVALVPAS